LRQGLGEEGSVGAQQRILLIVIQVESESLRPYSRREEEHDVAHGCGGGCDAYVHGLLLSGVCGGLGLCPKK